MGLDAEVERLVDEFLVGKAFGGGGEAIRPKEGEENGEDFRVSIDEDRIVSRPVREIE